MDLIKRQERLIDEFSAYSDWQKRYQRIIDMGKNLKPLAEEHKVEKNLVRGCQSQVWLVARLDADKRVIFEADSDALIVRGLVCLLLQVYSGATPDEILKTKPDFIEKLGFKKNLSPSRANGLYSMVKQIYHYATAFKVMLERGLA